MTAGSFSWSQAKQIAGEVYKLDVVDALKERSATLFILTSASGLRCAEWFALRINDLDFKAGTIRVDSRWTPFPAVESLVAPVGPSLTKDGFSTDDSTRKTT